MPGPRVGAFSITDKSGIHYMSCPACLSLGCSACQGQGRVRTHPILPASSYHPGTYVAMTPVPSHVNHIAPALPMPGAVRIKEPALATFTL